MLANPPFDHIWRNARIATMASARPGLGVIERGAVAVRGGRIAWIGREADIPPHDAPETNCEGRWITPGLIDCHTHLVYAGNRAKEFEMRLEGASYEEIARTGGGIVSSVEQVRAASEGDLLQETLPRLDALIAEGVTTVEVKSGYGLNLDSERKSLRVARQLGEQRPVGVRATFLGAHALPSEANGNNEAYIDTIVNEMLPVIASDGLADAVDGFCEGIAFSPEEIELVFDAATSMDLPVKLHADQLSDLGGGALAVRYRALSADHLEYTSESSVRAMAGAGTIATLLPGAYYFLRETQKPPIELFRRYGVPIAIATDSNPGTSPLTSLLLTMNMAATLFGLTVEECLLGPTRVAARALGLHHEAGSLEVGMHANLAIWEIEQPAELVYRIGFNPLWQRIWHGQGLEAWEDAGQ